MAKHKWLEIGVQLGISHRKLLEFKKEDDPLSAAVDFWLCGNVEGVPLTWRSVVEALKSEHVGEPGLARVVEKKYHSEVKHLMDTNFNRGTSYS